MKNFRNLMQVTRKSVYFKILLLSIPIFISQDSLRNFKHIYDHFLLFMFL